MVFLDDVLQQVTLSTTPKTAMAAGLHRWFTHSRSSAAAVLLLVLALPLSRKYGCNGGNVPEANPLRPATAAAVAQAHPRQRGERGSKGTGGRSGRVVVVGTNIATTFRCALLSDTVVGAVRRRQGKRGRGGAPRQHRHKTGVVGKRGAHKHVHAMGQHSHFHPHEVCGVKAHSLPLPLLVLPLSSPPLVVNGPRHHSTVEGELGTRVARRPQHHFQQTLPHC
mmetsp:Transcript_65058/g.111845  ORF Transcript_65058/g.111845 Transcript_65058/m.111845 type:complete len:223 (-) Transcript_65058:189-857(-)